MPAWIGTCVSGYRRGLSPSPQSDRRHQVKPFAAEEAADPIRSPILKRLFDQILEHERCPCPDEAATFCNLADFRLARRCSAHAALFLHRDLFGPGGNLGPEGNATA